MSDELLDEKQASERYGPSVATWRNWRNRRIGPKFIRLGGSERGMIRYRVSDIEKYLDERTIDVNAPSPREEKRTRRRGRRAA